MRYVIFLVLGAGIGAGTYHLLDSEGGGRSVQARVMTRRERDRVFIDQQDLIDKLRHRIAALEAELAGLQGKEPAPYPGDTVEKIEVLLQQAYGENNVDWLLQVIERLLLMGEAGFPALRAIIMDIAFRAKFRPSESDFRMDQIYTVGRIFTKHERPFMKFLHFLLTDPQTNKLIQQGAVPVAAFYVGSKAPGSEQLQEALLQMMLAQGGGGVPSTLLFGGISKRINIFAMMMSGDPKMVAPLRDELKNTKDKRMQGEILGALAYLGDPGVVPLIKDRLQPGAQGDFSKEIGALARVGTDEAHQAASDFVRAIPDSKRFYRHASKYIRAGGGTAGILLIKERIQANPDDPEIGRALGSLRRFPSKESHETLVLISQTSPDEKLAQRAADAAKEVDDRLKGILPDIAK